MSEKALLRKLLIILPRQVIQPTCPKTDGMILGLLAKAVRTKKQDLFSVREDGANPLVVSGTIDACALLLLRNWCCTEVILKKPQDLCSLT
jgi:hypothetical protein